MDMEEFCDKCCPIPARLTCRDGGEEVDCPCEADDTVNPPTDNCPFKDVDFSKVKFYEDFLNYKQHISNMEDY